MAYPALLLQANALLQFGVRLIFNVGTEWEREISQHLNTAQIILLLVSPDFMDSEYCYGSEMKKAMEGHERGEAGVIPVIPHPV